MIIPLATTQRAEYLDIYYFSIILFWVLVLMNKVVGYFLQIKIEHALSNGIANEEVWLC